MAYTSKFKGVEIDTLLEKVQNNDVGGIPIVSSIKELNALDAPLGSIASVAGNGNIISLSEIYSLGEDDIIQEGSFIKLKDKNVLTHVGGLQINIPPMDWVAPFNFGYLCILMNETAVDQMLEGMDLSGENTVLNAKMGVILVIENPETGVFMIGGVAGDAEILENLEDPNDITIASFTTENGFILDEDKLATFNSQLKEDKYYVFLGQTVEDSEEGFRQIDEVVKITSGDANIDLYIKQHNNWEISNQGKFNIVYNKIDNVNKNIVSVAEMIPTKNSQLENDSGFLKNEYYQGGSQSYDNSAIIENNTIKTILRPSSTVEIKINEEEPFYKGYLVHYQPKEGTTFIGDNIKVVESDNKSGKHLVEFQKLSDSLPIIGKSFYIGKHLYAYTRIEFVKFNNASSIYFTLGHLRALSSIILINRETSITSTQLNSGRDYYTGDVIEFYYSGGDLVLNLPSNDSEIKITHRKNDIADLYINPNNYNHSITLDTDYGEVLISGGSEGRLGSRLKKLTFVEGVKHVKIPYGNVELSNNLIYTTGARHVVFPTTVESFEGEDALNKIGIPSEEVLWKRLRSINDVFIYKIDEEDKMLDLSVPDYLSTLETSLGYKWENINSIKLNENIINICPGVFSTVNIDTLILPKCYEDWDPIIKDGIFKYGTVKNIKINKTNGSFNKIQIWYVGNKLIKAVQGLTHSNLESSNIEEIAHSAYYNCELLSDIKLPSQLRIVGDSAFAGCTSLKNIIIPKTVSTIGMNAFYNCNILYYDFSNHDIIPALKSEWTFGSGDFRIVVPISLYNDWIVTKYWTNVADNIVGVTTPLRFTVSEDTYITESGFTWDQYINSNFCNGPFSISEGMVMYDTINYVQLNGVKALASDVINDSGNYTILTEGSTETID